MGHGDGGLADCTPQSYRSLDIHAQLSHVGRHSKSAQVVPVDEDFPSEYDLNQEKPVQQPKRSNGADAQCPSEKYDQRDLEGPGLESLQRLSSDEVPRASMLGTMLAKLLKLLIRQKMEYSRCCQVSIGGDSFQLFRGEASSFRIYMQKFCYEGMLTTEAEAHTLGDEGLKFSLANAGRGGKLLARKVPMLLSVRVNEADATESLKRCQLLRDTVHECWNHIHGHPLKTCQLDGPNAPAQFPLPLPNLKVKLVDGLALYEEQVDNKDERCVPVARFALKFSIEKVDGREQLVVAEADWPSLPVRCGPTQLPADQTDLHAQLPAEQTTIPAEEEGPLSTKQSADLDGNFRRPLWRKVVPFPEDMHFQVFQVHNGWFCYAYDFLLDI